MAIGKRQAPSEYDDSPQRIRVSMGTYQRAALRKTLTQILLVILALLMVYVALAASVLRVVPATNGFTLVKNNSFSGGRVPANAVVLISTTTEQKDGVTDRLLQSFTPQSDTAIVKVLAGPAGALDWSKNGVLEVNNKELPVAFPVDPKKEFLNSEYVAICLEGSCNPGEPLFFPSNQIYGIPVGKEDFEEGASIDGLKDTITRSESRPMPQEIIVWVKGTNPELKEETAQCVSELFYKSQLPDEALRYFVDEMISGRIAKPKTEDAEKISAVYESKDARQCGIKENS